MYNINGALNMAGFDRGFDTVATTGLLGTADSLSYRIAALAAQLTDARAMVRRRYSFAVDAGAQGALTMFTVTGTVLVQVFGVCQADLTGATATVELGIAGNTAALIAQTVGTTIDQYQTWQDNATEANPGPMDLTALAFVIANGDDIILTIGTADLTAGIIDFYCVWTPLSAGATVVAA